MAKSMDDPLPPPHRPSADPASQSTLSDPDGARYAWARFRLLIKWSAFAALVVSGIAIWIIHRDEGEIGWVTLLAIFGGIGGSVMMGGLLMGLVFLSSGTGHDEDVRRIDPDA